MPHSNTPATRMSVNPVAASDATRLRVLAGTPHSRRGSVLVLVVGVLALLAIIIVVYTSVGQADVRGGRALVNQARMDDQSRAISEHLRDVIGADASATRVQAVYTGPGDPVYYAVLETTDYPYTDPAVRSMLIPSLLSQRPDPLQTDARPLVARFDPAGTISQGWVGGGNNLDPRVTSDPFLATIEPTWVNRDLNTLPTVPDPFALMARHRDWGHMSLVSPSGLPVNLANLRGRFHAPSGFTPAGPYTNATEPAMSDWMYTWARASNYSATPGVVQPTLDQYNSPATWSNDRLETFRTTTWNPQSLSASDVKFMGNMLADADGDGFYDALWQELVDVSDPASPSSLLQGGTGYRWFIAPRIIDLSGLVNVNTATSMAVPPDIENPAGITPSDIDLERLLTLADVRQYFGIHPDSAWVDAGSYNAPRRITEAGHAAFAGILEARVTGLAEVGENMFQDIVGPDLVTPPWLVNVGVERPTGVTGNGVLLGSVTRNQLYILGGKDETTGQLRTDSADNPLLKQNGGFGFGDERDLRAFGFVNDPRTFSRLEAVANADPRYALMSPLRSLRDLVTDRDAGTLGNNASMVTVSGETVPRAMAQFFTDPRHLLTTISGSRPLRYAHFRLAAADDPNAQFPVSDGLPSTADNPLPQSAARADIVPLLRNAVAITPDASRGIFPVSAANEIFRNYALALSPFLDNHEVWNAATGGQRRSNTLSFGGVTYRTETTGINVGETVPASDGVTQQTPARFTGRAAEIAVRTAAHMTANLMATQDDTRATGAANQPPDNRPIAATVLLDDSKRGIVGSTTYSTGVRAFPYWPQSLTGRLTDNSTLSPNAMGSTRADAKAYPFDLDMGITANGRGLLAGEDGTNQITDGYAINVFAAQPQPFITAAVSFNMYYDAPLANGGDSRGTGPADRDGEWEPILDPMSGATIGTNPLGITIDGTISSANQDFLMEMVAFQITNPFDVSITLGDPAGGFAYYIEFGGKTYEAAKYDDTGVRTGAITLLPRQSVCFYVLSQTPQQILTRWRAADPSIDALATPGNNVLQSWLKKQLTVVSSNSVAAYRTVQVDPSTGNPVPTGAAVHESIASSATTDANKVVRLWRVVTDNGGPGGENATSNDVANDYLVDRLRDPNYGTGTRAALYRRLDSGNQRFTGIDAGPEPSEPEYTGPASQRQNTGYAITLYGAIRRRVDPDGGPLPGATNETLTGVIPAWCIEAKHSSTYGFDAPTNAKNLTDFNPNFPDSGNISGIGPSVFTDGNYGSTTFRRMIGEGINNTAFTTAGVHPARRKGDNTPGDPDTDRIGDDFAGVSWTAGRKASQFPVYPRRSGTTIDTEVVKPPLRPADLLMPWAVGPYQNPTATVTGTTLEAQLEARHTTLSEAIAQGMNYSRSTNDSTYEFQIGKVLDRCHLPTDRFVPFNDVDNDGAWTYNTGGPDPMIANGIPFALNILDRFRTTRYGSTTSVAAGTLNINTAPLTPMRMLPMLTPASANVYGNDQFGLKGHWMNSDSSALSLKIKDEAGNTTNKSLWKATDTDRWDVAATLAAYRDKQAVVVRGDQDHEADGNRVYADFSPLNDGKSDTDASFRGGRPFITNVVNSRTEPGFKSIGEVMLAIVQDNTVRAGGQNLDAAHLKQLGIDRAEAVDNTNSPSNFQVPVTQITGNATPSVLGVTQGTGPAREQAIGWTNQAYIKPATVGPGNHFVHGGKSSDYDRKVGIANALMNCISTRSDLFCAYFVVHGYTEADVQGLEPWTGNGAAPDEDRYNRPMTPSVQRRYMMVLDRSQCTRPGDKPKVLMFEELPVK